MATTAENWIKQRLPADARFSKNGIVTNLDEAVTASLADYSEYTESKQKRYALADLLDILAADIKYQSETLGEWTGREQILEERARQYREEAESETGQPGSFSFVTATYNSQGVSDEFSV